jgi:hypothetical protein
MILAYSASPRLPVCLATQLYSIGPWLLAHYPRMCDFWDTIVPTASLQFRVDDLQTKTLSLPCWPDRRDGPTCLGQTKTHKSKLNVFGASGCAWLGWPLP